MTNNKLDAYLEEISHYLSGRAEREEILNEIRSHILEKAASWGGGSPSDEAIDEAITALGPARRLLSGTPKTVPLSLRPTSVISFATRRSFSPSIRY